MTIEGILAAIGGPGGAIVQPGGGSDVTPLSPLGLARTGAEPGTPKNVNAQQGAGSGAGGLYPGPGEPTSGTVHVGGNAPDSSTGPPQLPAFSGIASLTAG